MDLIDTSLIPEKWSGYKSEFGCAVGTKLRYFGALVRIIVLDFAQIMVYYWVTTFWTSLNNQETQCME